MAAKRHGEVLSEKGTKNKGATELQRDRLMLSGTNLYGAVGMDEAWGAGEVSERGRNGLDDKRDEMEGEVEARRIDLNSKVEAARESAGGGMVAARANHWQDEQQRLRSREYYLARASDTCMMTSRCNAKDGGEKTAMLAQNFQAVCRPQNELLKRSYQSLSLTSASKSLVARLYLHPHRASAPQITPWPSNNVQQPFTTF